MDITPIVPGDRQLVQAYGDGAFRISGRQHTGSVLVFPDQVVPWSGEINADGLAEVLARAASIEILIIGCGPSMTLIPSRLRHTLREAGIVIEPMDTGAGCRTYNVLLTEDRRVAAALVAV